MADSWLTEDLDEPSSGPSTNPPTRAARRAARTQSEAPMDVDPDFELGTGAAGTRSRGERDGRYIREDVAWDEEEETEETALQRLMRSWLNERHAPGLLDGEEAVVGRLLDHVRKQTDDVHLLRSDPSTSEEEHFRIMLVQTEIERVKFVVRSYIRARLFKIEKYARHIAATPAIQSKLSVAELEYAKRYAKLVEYHFTKSVLESLPAEQQGLEESVAFMPPMVPEPDKTRPVFAHARKTCPPVRLPDGTTMTMEKGQISLVPYYVVEQLLARGEVELV